MEELIKAIEEGKVSDFISSNHYRLSKEEIVELVKAQDYLIWSTLGTDAFKEFCIKLRDELLGRQQ